MTAQRYAGRSPDSDASIMTQDQVTQRFQATSVDLAYLDSSIDARASSLALKTYVDSRDQSFALKTAVDSADSAYALRTDRSATNGIATLDASGLAKVENMPTVRPDRAPVHYGITRWYLSGSTQISGTAETTYRMCEVTYSDPGWPFIPMVFGSFQCKSEEFTVFGRVIAKMANGDTAGQGLSTASLEWHSAAVIPHGNYQQSPVSYTGGGVITFYASKYFGPANLSVSSVAGFASVVLMPVF